MKKSLLLMAFISLCILPAANAQFEKGNIVVGLSSTAHLSNFACPSTDILGVGFATTKYGDSKYKLSYFNLAPRAGYFVIDNLAVGIDLVISTYKETDPDDNSSDSEFSVAAGPFVRYFYPLDKVNLFAEVGATFGSYRDKYNYGSGDNTDKASLTTIEGGIGAAFPLGDRVSFDVMVNYLNATAKEKDTDYKETSGGIGLKLGFMIYFIK